MKKMKNEKNMLNEKKSYQVRSPKYISEIIVPTLMDKLNFSQD